MLRPRTLTPHATGSSWSSYQFKKIQNRRAPCCWRLEGILMTALVQDHKLDVRYLRMESPGHDHRKPHVLTCMEDQDRLAEGYQHGFRI